jgi:subtilisin family serine protease
VAPAFRHSLLLALIVAGSACGPDHAGRAVVPTSPSPSRAHDAQAYRYSYIVVGKAANALPPSLASDVEAAGGTLAATMPQIGLAVVTSDRDDFAESAALAGIESVVPDLPMASVYGGAATELVAEPFTASALAPVAPPIPVGGDPLSGLQWALQAIRAPEAWALGYTGRGVRVAVLDGGIQSTHPDLAPNLNTALSTSFVPGQTYNTPPGPHGTQVSGIIAAARNDRGTVGVAPNAELVMVKILPSSGTGPISRIAQGLVYAADIGARVANISAGTNLPRATQIVVDDRGTTDPADDVRVRINNASVIALLRAMGRATDYAHSKGVLIVAAAGNLAKDFDHAKSDIGIPQELPHVITVGPTGPLGWALDPTTSLDVPPSYANFGQSYLSLAAPGGNFDVFTRPGLPPSCTLLTFTWPCQVFDIVLTTGLGGNYVWNFGGSFAAPHVSGVAALVIEKLGRAATPDGVEAILRNTADDLGKPGNDDFFGHGRVNALRAVERR